jgi:ATP-dependent Clp protease adaptor protein ClpS
MGAHSEDEQDGGVAVETSRPKPKEPSKYAVILLNDDYTTMEFVIEVLERFFRKTPEEAKQITLKEHHEGRGVAGIYPGDIAETKVAQVHEAARARGFPLRCTAEPV